ncbi:MAG: hypothetical protein IJC59_05465 [Lachnospiraceae bacterium]|nr:hypothetical protein [Lachnospiraceae bacterium]
MDGGNIVVRNLGLNPAVNFNFMLRAEGIFDLPCRSVRAFQKENEYETIQEGGLNDYVHLRRKAISKPFTFQVERYVGVDILDPLANGTDLVLPLILYVNRYSVYGEFYPVRMYVFTGCTVMSKEYGELNAEQSGLLLETTTIAYREMFAMDNPAASYLSADTWQFAGTGKEGNGNRKANYSSKELTRIQMEEKAVKWPLQSRAVHKENETKKTQMEELAKKWPEVSSASLHKNEMKKAQMEEKAKRWPEKSSAFLHENEMKKEQMEERSKRWPKSSGAIKNKNELHKKVLETKAKKWPRVSSATTVEDFMSLQKVGTPGTPKV